MNQDWHSGHFCCWQCDESLTGQRYVLRDEHPYCIKCYENVFANTCDECNKIIGIDSKVMTTKTIYMLYFHFLSRKIDKRKHKHKYTHTQSIDGTSIPVDYTWRERVAYNTLIDHIVSNENETRKKERILFFIHFLFVVVVEFIYLPSFVVVVLCFTLTFNISSFHSLFENPQDLSYKEKHWHEACFLCNKCRVSLVDKQFGSKAEKIYCGNCYDSQFASRCDGCGEVFRAGM